MRYYIPIREKNAREAKSTPSSTLPLWIWFGLITLLMLFVLAFLSHFR